MTKIIPLTQGYETIVDDEDYEKLNKYRWKILKTKMLYAVRSCYMFTWDDGAKQYMTVFMHREILNTPKGLRTDHIDGDGLNNQKSNLRICTQGQNNANRRKLNDDTTTSTYKGVYWNKINRTWIANISINNRTVYIGRFFTEEEAAEAYNKAAINNFKEFALINTIAEGKIC